jgi:nicotinamidase-related amidase
MTMKLVLLVCSVGAMTTALLGGGALLSSARAADVVTEWNNVKAPPAPALKPVAVNPKTTALLMLDFIKQLCNAQRFAHCPGTVPAVKKLLDAARAADALVVYTATLTPNAAKTDILPAIAPVANEPFVRGNIDKFYKTNLEKILKDKGIKTVIAVGVAAQGAVINTASDAAQRGFNVILPVDGISAQDYYYEQNTVWQLSHAPLLANRTTLTSTNLIKFQAQ